MNSNFKLISHMAQDALAKYSIDVMWRQNNAIQTHCFLTIATLIGWVPFLVIILASVKFK